jgi:hypothetical protein
MSLPSPEVEPERYRGRPVLVVVENYILAAIGELPRDDAHMQAIVQHAFGGGSDWMATVRTVLDLNDSIDASLQAMWARNQEIARQKGISLHPVQFAKMVADQNFAPFLDGTKVDPGATDRDAR